MYELAPWGIPEGLLGDRDRKVPTPSELQPCEVHDVLAYGRCYIVKPVGMPRMPAVLGSLSSSMLPIGPRDLTMLVPGSIVLCWVSDKYYAVILTVLASPVGSSQVSWPDSIVAAGHAGLFADSAHNQAITARDTSNGFLDFSTGAPVDGLAGDWGHTNELGMAVFLGRLMASIRAGELCKLEMHYADMLARLYAYNFQHYTAGSEDESFDDEGEFTRIRGFSPYPWEAAGVRNKDIRIFDQSTVNPKDSTDVFGVEPVSPLQGSFVRYREFEGFLGDLRRRFVMMPVPTEDRRLYGRKKSDPAQYKGLFEEVLSVDGSYLLRSAKSIGLEKTIWIPVPEELYPRDNPNGDHDLPNAAGQGMGFTEYTAPATAGQAIARTRDSQSYELNKRKSEPLNQRAKDWALRDDTTVEKGKINTPGNFTAEILPLAPYSTFEQDPIPPAEETVCPTGDRKSRFYQSKAFIGILDDGSILLRDGWGSEIRMVGGNIEITCPGDVVTRSGRTVQTWGGKDVIIKSQENLEMSSAKGNVRLKAENNLEVLGGNNGTGGVLVESRGFSDNNFSKTGDEAVIGGLVLKSSMGPVSVWGDSLYMGSTSGNIVMDAQGGDNEFVIYCRQFTKYLTSGSVEVIAAQKGATTIENTYVLENRGGSLSYYGLQANFGVRSCNIIAAKGSSSDATLTVSGGITSEGTVRGVGAYVPGSKPSQSNINNVRTMATESFSTQNASMRAGYDLVVTGDNASGNKAVWGLIGFSFRPSAKLGLGNMVIYEAEWQKRFRQSAGIKASEKYTNIWDEPDVSGRIDPDTSLPDPNRLTLPFPGKEAWDGTDQPGNPVAAKYAQADDQFYVTKVHDQGAEVVGGLPLPRGEKGVAYKVITQPAISEGAFKDRYPINKA